MVSGVHLITYISAKNVKLPASSTEIGTILPICSTEDVILLAPPRTSPNLLSPLNIIFRFFTLPESSPCQQALTMELDGRNLHTMACSTHYSIHHQIVYMTMCLYFGSCLVSSLVSSLVVSPYIWRSLTPVSFLPFFNLCMYTLFFCVQCEELRTSCVQYYGVYKTFFLVALLCACSSVY